MVKGARSFDEIPRRPRESFRAVQATLRDQTQGGEAERSLQRFWHGVGHAGIRDKNRLLAVAIADLFILFLATNQHRTMNREKLDNFERAFHAGTSGCTRACNCGRVFYDVENSYDWEDGELERLEK